MARHTAIPCALALLLVACAPPQASGGPPSATEDPTLLYAPHRQKGRFFNPWTEDEHGVWRLLRWQLFTRNPYDKRRAPEVPAVANDGRALATSPGSAALTWVGHATFAVQDGDDVFLTDPHFGERALFPRRLQPPGIPIASVPEDAFAVLSHNHYDHLDAWTVENLPANIGWYVPLGMAEWFRKRGRHDVVELDWWETAERGRWKITCLPSQHWSRRMEQGLNRALWCSWLLDSGDHRYYFAGDTGYFHGFAEFGRAFGEIDVALLPIGAFAPRWFMRQHHMDPAEAYQAFLDLGARFMVGMHWGTFDLTDEPMDLPPKLLAEVVAERGGDPERVRIMAIGERWKLEPPAAAQGQVSYWD
jgi:N-acyl-phosphatidylethanolamine-hydrolysing phospholipase D